MWEFAGTIAEALIFLLHFRMIFGTDVRVVLLFCMFWRASGRLLAWPWSLQPQIYTFRGCWYQARQKLTPYWKTKLCFLSNQKGTFLLPAVFEQQLANKLPGFYEAVEGEFDQMSFPGCKLADQLTDLKMRNSIEYIFFLGGAKKMASFISSLMQFKTPLQLCTLSLFLNKLYQFIDSFGTLFGFNWKIKTRHRVVVTFGIVFMFTFLEERDE